MAKYCLHWYNQEGPAMACVVDQADKLPPKARKKFGVWVSSLAPNEWVKTHLASEPCPPGWRRSPPGGRGD